MPRRRNDNDPLRRNISVRQRGPITYEWIYRRKGFADGRGRETGENAEADAWKSGLAHKRRDRARRETTLGE